MAPFHRLFLCRLCERILGGCYCRGCARVEEFVDSCATCAKENKK